MWVAMKRVTLAAIVLATMAIVPCSETINTISYFFSEVVKPICSYVVTVILPSWASIFFLWNQIPADTQDQLRNNFIRKFVDAIWPKFTSVPKCILNWLLDREHNANQNEVTHKLMTKVDEHNDAISVQNKELEQVNADKEKNRQLNEEKLELTEEKLKQMFEEKTNEVDDLRDIVRGHERLIHFILEHTQTKDRSYTNVQVDNACEMEKDNIPDSIPVETICDTMRALVTTLEKSGIRNITKADYNMDMVVDMYSTASELRNAIENRPTD